MSTVFFEIFFGHALSGVRVQKVQKVQRGKVLRIDRPDGRRILKFDGLSGRGLWYRPAGDEYEVSVTDSPFCVIWHDRHSVNWLAALASPYPAAPDFSTGKRVTRFSGRFAPLRIVFPCHPCSGGRIGFYAFLQRHGPMAKHP